jgi:hypothetical protein
MASDLAPKPPLRTRLYQRGIGLFIWAAFAVAGGAALYGLSILAGD